MSHWLFVWVVVVMLGDLLLLLVCWLCPWRWWVMLMWLIMEVLVVRSDVDVGSGVVVARGDGGCVRC